MIKTIEIDNEKIKVMEIIQLKYFPSHMQFIMCIHPIYLKHTHVFL